MINKRKVLLVEGRDEEEFFAVLLKDVGLADVVQVMSIGGVDQMKSRLETFRLHPGFEMVESLGIIRDADQSLDSAVQSLHSLLNNIEFPSPSEHNTFAGIGSDMKVGIFVMPGTNVEGTMLEDLCLKTVENEPLLPLIDQYFQSFQEHDIELPSNVAKAKVQVFLASQKKIVNSLGLGARKNYWNLDHNELDAIKEFLNNM